MKFATLGLLAALSFSPVVVPTTSHAQTPPSQVVKVKTRLDHLTGTPNVLVISNLPSEITSITCEKWKMMGVGSWKHQNDFSIPAAADVKNVPTVSVAILDSSGFDGYCAAAGSIVAHTDDGDAVGVLDAGAGNWKDSTKLTFTNFRN